MQTMPMWWQQPLRIIQPNLQVQDTARIEPERLVQQIKTLGANAMVFNTGGIYAWYPSQVRYHTINAYLPDDRDLLEEVIAQCHQADIRFIARFDFSKAADHIYLQRPEWFVRREADQPEVVGAMRPGPWPLLMSTCLNGGYRNEELAMPVLREVLQRYNIDGVFFNAPHYVFCRCAQCRIKYAERYNKELPDTSAQLEPDFAAACFDDNIGRLYRYIKTLAPDLPVIVYYNLHRDRLLQRSAMADLLCTEPQDVLSRGQANIPAFWLPALSIKVGRSLADRPDPFGIVHSCPGMDWRHTGLPPAEYRFWLAQIPANGGQIWHSLTGVPDTITDKRILEVVQAHHQQVAKVAPYMAKARSLAQVALLWHGGSSAEDWAEALIRKQIPFDVLLPELLAQWETAQYQVVLLSEGFPYTDDVAEVLANYVQQGGRLIVEGNLPEQHVRESSPALRAWPALLGIADDYSHSEYLYAAYLRFEAGDHALQSGLEQTELIPFRGKVTYCKPLDEQVQVLATLVPPFSPLDGVGAPPERASLPVPRTDLPLAISHCSGAGETLYFPFALSALLREFKLDEHYCLLANSIDAALGHRRFVQVSAYPGLQLTVFRQAGHLLIHLVNGAGERPLARNLPLHDIEIVVRGLPDLVPAEACAQLLLQGGKLHGKLEAGCLHLTLSRLEVWECLLVPITAA